MSATRIRTRAPLTEWEASQADAAKAIPAQREAGRGLMAYAEIDTAIAVVAALENGTGDRATGEAAMAQLTRNGLDGQGRRLGGVGLA